MPDLLDIAENAAVQRVDPAARDRSVRIAQRSDARSNALQLHELVVMARLRHLITVLGTS